MIACTATAGAVAVWHCCCHTFIVCSATVSDHRPAEQQCCTGRTTDEARPTSYDDQYTLYDQAMPMASTLDGAARACDLQCHCGLLYDAATNILHGAGIQVSTADRTSDHHDRLNRV